MAYDIFAPFAQHRIHVVDGIQNHCRRHIVHGTIVQLHQTTSKALNQFQLQVQELQLMARLW